MGYSIDAADDRCYPGTSVLVNKLDIREQTKLDESEALILGVKSVQFELAPFPGPLDFDYYKQLHRFLFDALYDWAGTIRDIDLSKQHTRFCPATEIDELAHSIFGRLASKNYLRSLARQGFIAELADLYNNINYLHPFREGNGRAQRLYFRQLAREAGYKLDFSAVDSDTMMLATIHASGGIMDTLLQVFDFIITVSQ